MNEYNDDLECIEDIAVLNKIKGCLRESKHVPRFRDRVDTKRFKSRFNRTDYYKFEGDYGFSDEINGTAIQLKERE